MNKELEIVNKNNNEAAIEMRKLLNNDKLDVRLNKYNTKVIFNNEEIVTTGENRDGKIISSFKVCSMIIDDDTSDDIINNYAAVLKLSSRMMEKETRVKINELLAYYITKTENEIKSLKIS